jgi:hypothetical protein
MSPSLQTKYVFTITVWHRRRDRRRYCNGARRIIPIIGGEVRAQSTARSAPSAPTIIRPNELIELEAKYAFETDDGAVVYVENKGIRFGPVSCCRS